MLEPDLIELFVAPLNRLGIKYLITGSVAAMLYGEPRVTHDVDILVFLRVHEIDSLAEYYPSPEFYMPPTNVIVAEMSREKRGQFNIIHVESGLKADLYLIGHEELDGWAFRHAVEYSIRGNRIRLAPPEYVILRKLEFFHEGGSDKHLRDIAAMLNISGDQIDRSALNDWITRMGLEAEWSKAREGAPGF
jgi:hypothetical protein